RSVIDVTIRRYHRSHTDVVVHAADLGWLTGWLAGWQVCGVCVRFPVVDSALAVHRALSP
ncbi:hypothetical protein V3C99_000093, partial [Haemonchus contortus]